MQNSVEIKAKTLEEALVQASISLNCPIINLQYEVIQMPSKGFLNIGKKEAIILASVKESPQAPLPTKTEENNACEMLDIQLEATQNLLLDELNKFPKEVAQKPIQAYTHSEDELSQIRQELKDLFSHLPYKIDKVEVSLYEPGVLLIDIDGEDSALLIGEKGYRYKALSYLLFNWIHPAYGYNIRLEISTFLQNQEKVMDAHLQSVIMSVHEVGKAQMKALDGVLTYIALKKLRKTFPNKYVSLKTNLNDEKYIVINDFNNE
ncbi:Jag N-terminal domain-containing protein [Helicobacter cetorum]|uniref:RNA-binding protein KhpB N-terminal domain-containing protein n=1 Tax=Helicobacter cetorum (strain ATCC BAA-540 / CCUG 52418 / MIT 99-5656) TaxID=1163745 RepID=I0EQH7_HELCM|nr:Jag N-terminal domain-containing protein [Helicobacter cetorum]AFI05196.1 hypothetical protein HCD_00820 [Helicobacter cetorum MIT 99-5656]